MRKGDTWHILLAVETDIRLILVVRIVDSDVHYLSFALSMRNQSINQSI